MTNISEKTVSLLKSSGLTLVTAESCTGGLIAKMITDVSGSSSVFECGIVSYSNRIKSMLLDVPEDILLEYGAVSQQTAVLMAQGVLKKSGSDIGVGITGIAGPTGGTPDKPVGTVWIAWATPEGTQAQCFHFGASREREQITLRAVTESLVHLIKLLNTK